jgi:D-alanine-D-alanine ligase-like ATP-grasp enzyme
MALRFPVIVKPALEGSSKGISSDSIVLDEAGLRRQASEVASRYRQPVLCEEYVNGREITVGLLGLPVQVLPAMEVVFLDGSEHPCTRSRSSGGSRSSFAMRCPPR